MPRGVHPEGRTDAVMASYGIAPTYPSTACRLASRKSSIMSFGSGAAPE
jgi:hypothetical protein